MYNKKAVCVKERERKDRGKRFLIKLTGIHASSKFLFAF